MASSAQTISGMPPRFAWFGQFLKHELAPYPGRTALVARMVIATTITMIICMTFRLSYAFQGAIFCLLISRESPRSTLQSGETIFLFIGIGAAYIVASAWFVISFPFLHLLWVVASLFVAFYGLSSINNYSAASTFAIIIAIGIPLWDRYVPAETNVEDTLRLVLATAVAAVVTVTVEIVFVRGKPGDDIVLPLAERLAAVEKLLLCIADNWPVSDATKADLERMSMTGTSILRRILQRSNYSSRYAEQMNALVSLIGRIVDIAILIPGVNWLSQEDTKRIRRLAQDIAGIRSDLLAGRAPHLRESLSDENAPSVLPFLPEMEKMVSLIAQSFVGSQPLTVYTPREFIGEPRQRLFAWDTRSNAEHLKFALKGCLTASICYIIYNAIDWPGISTCVTTCLLTALSTIGSSRQKQVLRFAGAVFGGFVLGMGAQIFILPHIDSIAGFTVLFVLVTFFAAWIMTSSARLSYFGIQVALAFYFINLEEFAIQHSLAIARDRVVGVLFGLLMMWLVFDQLWGASAVVQMKKTFVSAIRLLAQYAREPVSPDLQVAVDQGFSLREAINSSFDNVRSSADGVLLEFGPSREQNLAWRSAIREWQPELRTLFLTQIALWKYRARLPELSGLDLPEAVRARQRELAEESAKTLDTIADRLEGKATFETAHVDEAFDRLQQTVRTYDAEHPQKTQEAQFQTWLGLCSRSKELVLSLSEQIRPLETASVPRHALESDPPLS